MLRREQVDILQVHFADSTSLAVAAGWLARVPCIVRTRRDLEYWKTARQKRYGRRLDGIYNRFRVDAMVTNSKACQSAVLHSESPPPRRIEIIPNGVMLSRFQQKANGEILTVERRSRMVGIVAMLRPEKRLDLFVEAAALVAARHPSAQFRILGEGKQRPMLVSLAEQLGISDRLKLLGKTTDVPDFLTQLDVAVLCSDSEGLPNAVLEYMAAGKAIVATDVGGTPELIQNEVNGLLVPPRDKHRLADAICRVLDDPSLALRLSTVAREQSLAFSVPAMIQRYQSLYADLLESSRRRRLGICAGTDESLTNLDGR
jgi:glycosyltransferase involved in cell wall biosynthesis